MSMFRETTLDRAGYRLNHVVGPGNGPPLLMLHGVTRSWNTFLPLMPFLLTRWQIWGLDFRGHGGSAPVPGGYLVRDYSTDAEALIDAMAAEPVVVYGHSLGAMVAAGLAANRPDRVRAILLEDPPMHTMGKRIGETPWLGFFQGLKGFAGSPDEPHVIAQRLAELRVADPRTGTSTRLGDVRDAASLRFTAAGLRRLDPEVLNPIIASRWLDGYDMDAIFSAIRCPVLLVQADPAAGGALTDDDARRLAALAADATHVRLDGIGHLIHGTATERLANLLLGFLESLGAMDTAANPARMGDPHA